MFQTLGCVAPLQHIILMGTSRKLSFLTWNIRGFKRKTEEVMAEIEKHECHVAFIQETHINSTDKNVFASLDHWKPFFTKYKPKERGVAILIRKEIVGKSKIWTRKDTTGCYIVVKCTIKGQLYTLVSVYVHQVDSRPLKRLRMILENFAEGILLIGGDFNIALNTYLDRDSLTLNERHFMLKPTVEKFMTSFHLVDVWRRLNPIARQYTYSIVLKDSKEKIPISRLDYVFVPEESVQCVQKCRISEENCCSDHQPVLFEIRCNTNRKSPNHLDVRAKEKMDISKFVSAVSNQWLSCKEKFWGRKFVFTFSQDAFKLINVLDVQKAIESLAGNEKVKRKDGVSLLFYKSYYCALIPYLCAFYHKVLEQPMTIPKSFNEGYPVFQHHYIFNVDYLILATIMARWLSDHLDSHSTDYIVDKKCKKVLFTFKKGPKMVPWSFFERCFNTEQQREPRLHTKFKIDILENILQNSPDRRYKILYWGCPLTPVLMRLFLIHIAERFVEHVKQPKAKIHISIDNVIVSLSENVSRDLLEKAETELPCVHCKFVDELTRVGVQVATNSSNS
ncbi:uncharacterized protein LOC127421002 [Myxocyprinus asiaticus]|uniref:uncharacterized protein LOC127421002 n=1 Tax=Myxocyprinus asiaticus TaxID=70543 RepID=UPI002221FDB2|nr:uncharacterized protein LOC127421002 [Myxocyprinus asiaticus]